MHLKKILVGSILLALIGCNGKKEEKVENKIQYKVAKAGIEDSRGYINVEGSVEAKDTKKVFVDKKLKVKEVFVQEGDYVEKGKVLMTFDETERNNIKRNLEKERLSLSKLKRDYKVEKELNKIGGSSANYVKDLSEEIKSKELTIDSLNEDLDKTAERILSPVSGTITSLLAQENYSVNTDEPLLELADLSDMKIVLEVPEYDVKNIEMNQKLIIKPEVFEKKKSYGGVVTKVSTISKVSEETSENVLEVEVKPDEKIPYIVPGFKVSATIYLDSNGEGIVIPKTALLFGDNEYYIYLVGEGNKLIKSIVKYKDLKGNNIEIIKGLEKNSKYVVNPSENLKAGDIIEVKKI
ncbi:efflux RND transporter periplasmic adaptor subunit [uncultured Cetobacterium sp.]|uniref:efflux RND transporter periplasmic adaptor subunit n=1 Tax=uncultured Cetobacterium sp. TaxID=527638 RepID=UPI0026196FB1|nr:efflux RND transporter periplasmic adaptor subunit [uncultured Cetobacterium sp.]